MQQCKIYKWLGELNPGISGLEKCPGSREGFRDPGINSLVGTVFELIRTEKGSAQLRYGLHQAGTLCEHLLWAANEIWIREVWLDSCLFFVELFTDKCVAYSFETLWMNLLKYTVHCVLLSFKPYNT